MEERKGLNQVGVRAAARSLFLCSSRSEVQNSAGTRFPLNCLFSALACDFILREVYNSEAIADPRACSQRRKEGRPHSLSSLCSLRVGGGETA